MPLEATLGATIGDDVSFVFTVANASSEPIELTFPSGKHADVIVYEADPRAPVWQWSRDRMFTQAIEQVVLTVGETFERTFTWDDPFPGQFTAVATLEADIRAAARTRFAVS